MAGKSSAGPVRAEGRGGLLGWAILATTLVGGGAWAAGPAGLRVQMGTDESSYLRLVLLFASVSLAPALLAVVTSFARIIVVLFFLRAGLGSTQLLPNPVLMGVALLLTACTMQPLLRTVHRGALQPFLAGRMSLEQAATAAQGPLREHLSARAGSRELALMRGGGTAEPGLAELAAAYALSELRVAFLMGFVIYLPFLVIDLVVGGTLVAAGMVSLPQAAVALPFKVLLFVMVDGWRLLTEALVRSLA